MLFALKLKESKSEKSKIVGFSFYNFLQDEHCYSRMRKDVNLILNGKDNEITFTKFEIEKHIFTHKKFKKEEVTFYVLLSTGVWIPSGGKGDFIIELFESLAVLESSTKSNFLNIPHIGGNFIAVFWGKNPLINSVQYNFREKSSLVVATYGKITIQEQFLIDCFQKKKGRNVIFSSNDFVKRSTKMQKKYGVQILQKSWLSDMNQVLKRFKFKYKSKISADGNCQFESVSDSLYGDVSKAKKIRELCCDWLDKKKDFLLGNGEKIASFLDKSRYKSWKNFVKMMRKNGEWGNNVTLIAICQIFQINIFIISNLNGGIISILEPQQTKKNQKRGLIHLCHFHEYHYRSVEEVLEEKTTPK